MKNKFENLPIGTVVKVGIEYLSLNDNHRIMTVIGYDSEQKEGFNKVYRVKELQDNKSYNYILPKEIERIISYPIDRDKLKRGVKIKVRDDLEVGESYGKLNWEIKRESVKGKVVEVKNFYLISDYIDVKGVEDFSLTPEMLECIIEEPEVTHMRHEEIKVGMKLKLRDDLVQWKEYGSFGWNWDEAMRMDKCVVTEFDHNTITIKDREDYGYTAEMFECEIKEELVDGIEAWNQMNQGKYASHGGWLGKIVNGKLHKTHKVNEKPWKFVRSNVRLNRFMEGEYQILDELPDWAQEPVNPFKVGDIVTFEIGRNTGSTREVTEVIDGEKFMTKEIDGGVCDWNVRTHRPATQKEELNYWKKRAKYWEER